jgi:signal transduction histidine kinase
MNKYIYNIFIFSLLLAANSAFTYSQFDNSDFQFYIAFDNIIVNGLSTELNQGALVLSDKDSISITYTLKSKSNNQIRSDYFYRIKFTDGIDTSVSTSGFNVANYKNLQQGKYYIILSAFAVKDKWNTGETILPIIVDNNLAALIAKSKEIDKSLKNQIDSLNKAKLEQDSLLNKFSDSFWFKLILIFLAFVSGFGLFFAIFYQRLKTLKTLSEKVRKRGVVMSINELASISQEEYQKIASDNSSLKGELAAMKGQIDAMLKRGNELTLHNKELEEKLDRLSNSKSDLEELARQKDELFAIVIHDIKNPAALIKNLVDLLRSYDLTANEQQEIIEDIAETTLVIVQLSQEVTKILNLESGLMHLDFEDNPITEIIEDIVTRNKVAANKKNMTIFTEFDKNLPYCELDAQKIDEVLDNLVSNAIKFTQNGGTIRVKAYKELRDIIVEVSDNGLGLSEDDVAKAFRRGQKLSAHPTGDEFSTGMGLWIVKKIVDAHHGKVWIKSLLGKGSTFAFSLPQKQEKR